MRKRLTLFSLMLFCLNALASSALAYIDPGTGSYIFQIFIAFAVGVGFALKTFWRRILTYLSQLFTRGEKKDRIH